MTIKTYESVWDALEDDQQVAANLKVRAELLMQLQAVIKSNNWKQALAAEHCDITQPRVNDLLKGRIANFSVDALVNIATALGQRVNITLEAT